MSAIQDALKLYGTDFPRLHGLYLERGYCYSEPSMLALARPCNMADYKLWVEPHQADAWWVELVVGPGALGILYSHIPFALPNIGWRRDFKGDERPRFHDFHKLANIIKRHGL